VGSELETVIEPLEQLQRNLNEQAFVIPENTDVYNCASHDTSNGSDVKEANIPHNGLGNEVEKTAVNSIPADVPAAAITPLTFSDRIPVGHVHS
jgi:saccharopine dehydrogenase-like NADP-dependent oxidoreductase